MPNGDAPSAGFTLYHCGELIERRAILEDLKLEFSKEALDTEKAFRTLSLVIGPEETFDLEDLAYQLKEYKKHHIKTRITVPPPTDSLEDPLNLVTYLRILTSKLISVKKECLATKYKIDDSDFISDVGQCLATD